MARARVHHQAGGLGAHHHVGVLVTDGHRDRRIGLRPAGRGGFGQHLDDVVGLEPVALRHLSPVDPHGAGIDQALHLAPGPSGQERDGAVDPLPRERVGHGELLGHGAQPRAARCSSRSVRTAQITMTTAPTVMAESATLNVGKLLTCTKSTTAPLRNPGERNRRSARFPSAPPSTNDKPITMSVSRVRRTARTSSTATPMATTASSGVNAWNRLNALPVLRVSAKPMSSPMTVTGASTSSRTAHSFESWSSTTTPRTIAVASSGRPVGREVVGGAGPPALAASLGTSLAVDARLGVRQRLESLEADAATGRQAQTVRLVLDARERAVDLVDDLLGRGGEQEIALPFDVDGVALARLLVELRVAAFTLGRELLGLRRQLIGLLDVAGAFRQEARLE